MVEEPKRNRVKPNRLTYHVDTTQEYFVYNVSLDRMDDQRNSYYWEVQDVLGHKKKKDQTIHLKIEWIDGEKSWEMVETIKYHSLKKVLEYVFKNNLINLPGW